MGPRLGRIKKKLGHGTLRVPFSQSTEHVSRMRYRPQIPCAVAIHRGGTDTTRKAFHCGRRCSRRGEDLMRIEQHDKSHIVELEDGSRWQIWPGDIATTLQWLPTTELQISAIHDELCSHALIDREGRSRVRVIEASAAWPVAEVRQSLKDG